MEGLVELGACFVVTVWRMEKSKLMLDVTAALGCTAVPSRCPSRKSGNPPRVSHGRIIIISNFLEPV